MNTTTTTTTATMDKPSTDTTGTLLPCAHRNESGAPCGHAIHHHDDQANGGAGKCEHVGCAPHLYRLPQAVL